MDIANKTSQSYSELAKMEEKSMAMDEVVSIISTFHTLSSLIISKKMMLLLEALQYYYFANLLNQYLPSKSLEPLFISFSKVLKISSDIKLFIPQLWKRDFILLFFKSLLYIIILRRYCLKCR